ncbi:hypothetical protein F2Q69_00033171 [Brassica cretica]|uniref:Uncharacterized protein n=1 Tax=Brassica cretica TaxID=69181 RepID=A0A8S9SC02_BRACR|nr:hypothetical protein F2Q69_00033171 [Brassica cretica]
MEEMIRRIQSRFDRDSTLVPEASERVNDRANSILNRLMTSRGVRSEQNQASAASEDIDLNPNIAAPDLEGETTSTRFHPLTHPLGRSHHQELHHHSPVVIDDIDSFSSIAAVINSESQVDTAVEID